MLFVLALDNSASDNPIATTPTIEIIQEISDKIILPLLLFKISPFFKNIPAPIEEPITNNIAEKNDIFLCFTSFGEG